MISNSDLNRIQNTVEYHRAHGEIPQLQYSLIYDENEWLIRESVMSIRWSESTDIIISIESENCVVIGCKQ